MIQELVRQQDEQTAADQTPNKKKRLSLQKGNSLLRHMIIKTVDKIEVDKLNQEG